VRLRIVSASQFARERSLLHARGSAPTWFEAQRLPDGSTYLRWERLFEFAISADGRSVRCCRLGRATNHSLTTYLLGQVLSFSLLSFGYEPLHATAVVVNGEAVAFLGDCGYGKSTLGASFVARGFPMLTDDVLALEPVDGRWLAHAGPPRVKLFPAVSHTLLSRSGGRPMNPDTSKLIITLAAGESVDRTVPLKTLYVLSDPSRNASTRSRVRITRITGHSAFVEATRASFNLIQVDRARLKNQFALTSQLVSEVPLKRLTYPRRLSQIGAVCDAVLADLNQTASRKVG
jgi:hypothetical protein